MAASRGEGTVNGRPDPIALLRARDEAAVCGLARGTRYTPEQKYGMRSSVIFGFASAA